MTEQRPTIRQAEPTDADWISCFLRERWHATTMAVHGKLVDAAALAALIAENGQGLATYRWHGGDAELVSLDAVPAHAGIGTALIEALTTRLRAEGCARLWLTMTNANLPALRFYLRRGFRLMQVRPGAVDEARKLKPSIPTVGEYGIPMHDELDLCRVLDPTMEWAVPFLPPWNQIAGAAPAVTL
jgi:GNAT superfamily N-acetyltransferase